MNFVFSDEGPLLEPWEIFARDQSRQLSITVIPLKGKFVMVKKEFVKKFCALLSQSYGSNPALII